MNKLKYITIFVISLCCFFFVACGEIFITDFEIDYTGVDVNLDYNEELSLSNLFVKAKYNDGSSSILSSTEYTIEYGTYTKTTTGSHTIKVIYGDFGYKTFIVTVGKSNYDSAPGTPTLTQNETTLIVKNESNENYSDAEYKLFRSSSGTGYKAIKLVENSYVEITGEDDGWQTSNQFENLTPCVSYMVYVRFKETSTHFVSGSVSGIIEFGKLSQSAPSGINVSISNANLIISAQRSNEITTLEYLIKLVNTNNTETEVIGWASETTISGLTRGKTYKVYCRHKANEIYKASAEIFSNSILLPKENQNAPISALVSNKSTTGFTIASVNSSNKNLTSLYEYKVLLDGQVIQNWDSSNNFFGLTTNTTYTILIRFKETETKFASNTYSLEVTTL